MSNFSKTSRDIVPSNWEIKVAITPYRRLYFVPDSILYSNPLLYSKVVDALADFGKDFLYVQESPNNYIYENLDEDKFKKDLIPFSIKIYYTYYNEPRMESVDFRRVNKIVDADIFAGV